MVNTGGRDPTVEEAEDFAAALLMSFGVGMPTPPPSQTPRFSTEVRCARCRDTSDGRSPTLVMLRCDALLACQEPEFKMAIVVHGDRTGASHDLRSRFFPGRQDNRAVPPARARVRFREFVVRRPDEVVSVTCPKCHGDRSFRLAAVVRQVLKHPQGGRWDVTTHI